MGCGPSNSSKVLAEHAAESDGVNAESMAERIGYPPGTAFTISFDENSENVVPKEPPERLQRMQTFSRSQNSSTTMEDLEEKLATAEIRRKQFLSQRTNTKTRILNFSEEMHDTEGLPKINGNETEVLEHETDKQ